MIQGKIYTHSDGTKYVEIPKGWRRISENGSIHYISPTSNYLKSYENIIEYLKKDGTCKCGLDCPFHIHRVFNFDINVLSKEQKDDVANNDGHSSTCKLCDSQWLKNEVDQMLLQQKPLNQAIKQTARKAQFSFDGTHNKKANRSRSRLNDGPKAKRSRNMSSPLSDVPSPPPLPNSSPVQNVPNNIGALNQGPLPSFASIVSSSKFFNPGPNRGPLHPTGSLPLESNNKFAFPKILTPSTVTANVPTTQIVMPQVMSNKPVVSLPSTSTVSTVASLNATSSSIVTTLPSTVTLVNTAAVSSIMTNNQSVVVPIINTPTLPSVFAPLDGVGETIKTKPPPKSRSRPRALRAKPKAKAEAKQDNKKLSKGGVSTGPVMTGLMPTLTGTAAMPQWSPMSTTAHNMQFQTPSNSVAVSSSTSNTASVMTPLVQGIVPISRQVVTSHSVPQSVSLPTSINMSSSYHNHSASQAMQVSSPTVSNCQVPPALTSPTTTMANGGRENVSSFSSVTPSSATMSSAYSVVATPRMQAPPGMMYVAAAPGIGMFPGYSYATAAAAAQQIQMSQPSTNQPQNKTSSSTTSVSISQQPVTQGVSSESAPGKVNVQIPGMYVQSAAGNQMFPVNAQGYGANQYKTPYQFQNAVYPNAIPGSAMTFIAPNGAKATYPGIPAMAGQFAYPNPYMFGIFMPTTTNQPSQPSTTSSTSTRSSPATPTSVTTPVPMIQQQGLPNPAIAARIESFVPIAPAAGGAAANAAPRFAQTLAHLASAYNTYSPQGGLLQGANANQLHLAYQMMQMNPHVNVQQIANLGGLPANDNLKHPTPPATKGGPSPADSSKASSNTQCKTSSQTPPANSPGTPASQDHGVRSPFTFPHTSTSTSLPPSQSSSTVAVTIQSQQNAVTNTRHNQNTLDQHGLSNYSETVKYQYESGKSWQSESGKGISVVSQAKKPISTNGPSATDQSDSTNTEHCKISPLGNQKNISEQDFINRSAHSVNQSQSNQSVNNDNQSPVRTHNTPFEQNVNTNDKPGNANSRTLKKDIPNQLHSKGSALIHNPKQLSRTVQNSDSVQSPSYDDTVKNYYATNPLLGMKRSCEAIEVYPEPKERLEDDKEEYYSATDDSNEGGTLPANADEPTSDCGIDLRHGEDSNVEEPIRIAEQNTTGLHNGGCNPTHSEHDNNPELDVDNYVPNFFADSMPVPQPKRHFNIGDIVWAQARGLPSWPGQIVDENRVGKGQPDDGKKWVMWFGDHTFSQVEEDRLKTLNEGLRALDDKSRKKRYRAKKARISLEQAIAEALKELQMREQVKERQEMAPKPKKKRLR